MVQGYDVDPDGPVAIDLRIDGSDPRVRVIRCGARVERYAERRRHTAEVRLLCEAARELTARAERHAGSVTRYLAARAQPA